MTLTGKGYYIWKIRDAEGGNPHAILARAQAAGLSHVLIKVADGERIYNYVTDTRTDLVKPVAKLLQDNGIQVWGWQYIYGDAPVSEARRAIQRTQELNLDGFVINAEAEFKANGMDVAARGYARELRNGLPNTLLALSSFRFPSYHPQFPFDEFLEFCDLNMPQVYWLLAHNPDAQLRRTVAEFQSRRFVRPIVPTGSAYAFEDWKPTAADMKQFLDSAQALRLNAANFWSWDYARRSLPAIWDAVATYNWPTAPLQKDVTELYMDAMNAHDPVKIATMYTPTGAHFYKKQALQGPADILKWYHTFFTQTFPKGTFALTGVSGAGSARHFTWVGTTLDGRQIMNGKDTIGVQDGKIAYHYKFFSVM